MTFQKIVVEAKQNHGASQNIKEKARWLRKNMTNAEKLLWKKLRNRQQNGKYFRRQHPFGIYILDFYCFEANLVIEIDGEIHLGHKKYDQERTDYLNSAGLRVLRFKNEDVENNLDSVIDVIIKSTSLPAL
ncbi:MAG TPA: endonuclease domain-containing protein [Bacteroidales bacterium]|jgi:very-short-patch-repair endonuclease|nr:endonuclease domain-containing protein [Bacteroidales bacterium]